MKRRKAPSWLSPLISALVLLSLFLVFWISLRPAEPSEESINKLQNAVMDAAVQCFALEGAYPATLEYLETHYGLSIDHARFSVTYEADSANMRPNVIVVPMPKGFADALGG